MATCSKRKVSFFIRDILCAESSHHVTSSTLVTSPKTVTSQNDVTSAADDTKTLRRCEDRKGRQTKSVCEGRSVNNVLTCHIVNKNINDTIHNSNTIKSSTKNSRSGSNDNGNNNNDSNNNSGSSNSSTSGNSSNNNTKSNSNNNCNNNCSNNNSSNNKATSKKSKDINVNTKATSLQQQHQKRQQQQQLPVPIPLVPGHHWPPHTSAQRLFPTSGTGELPVCTWGGVRPPYLYTSTLGGGRGLGPLVPGGAPTGPGLLPLPCSLPPVSAPPGGGGYGRVGYGGGQGGDGHHRCGVYRCNCGGGDIGASSGLGHPGLQYLGGPVPYPAYTPPVSRSSLPVPIPLPVYLRTRASPNSDGNSRPRKCRRSRTVFSELQLMGLERRFDDQKYLSTPDRGELARTLGLTQVQVKTWYQNRRMKWKKQVLQGGATEPPTKPKGRPRKEQQQVVTMDTTASSTANQHSDRPEVTCQDVPHVNMSTGGEDDVDCETGSDSDGDDVAHNGCDAGSDIDSDVESEIDVQIT